MSVHDHFISDDSIDENTPPSAKTEDSIEKEPPPPQPPPTPKILNNTSYVQGVIDKWVKMTRNNKGYTKARSSKPLLTEAQIREDVDIIRMINRGNKNIRLQCDGGANTSVTNDETILHHIQDIPDYSIGGIGDGINCTKKGIFYLQCDNNEVLPVQMYFSPQATETVVSPTDTVTSHFDKFDSWHQLNNVKQGTGHLRFSSESGFQHMNVPLKMTNKLWYINQPILWISLEMSTVLRV